jgi:hypothetical protein
MILTSCSAGYEVVNPYKNLGYSGDRLFPIKTNHSEFSLRIWISNSTSIDRVISISKDKDEDYQGSVIEFGKLFNGKVYTDYYKNFDIKPKDGFSTFKQQVDSLNLLNLKTKPDIEIVYDQPFSTYVIEIKEDNSFNTFRFNTYYPYETEQEDIYSKIEKYITNEFDIQKLFKFKK